MSVAETLGVASMTLSTVSESSRSDVSGVGLDTQGKPVHYIIKGFANKTHYAEQIISVGPEFEPVEGAVVREDLHILRFLAQGWQGGIYLMADADGNQREDVLLKILKPNAVLGDLAKEWAIGQSLNVLANTDGYLPGFMKTREAICVDGERGIRGMLIERLNGKIVEDTLSAPKFNDICYIRDMLFQVLRALDRAYTVLGFKHADLRLTNIMEHYPNFPDTTQREFKIIDFGLSSIQERSDSKLFQRLASGLFSKIQDPAELARVFLNTLSPKQEFANLSAAVYKLAWIGHGDVYHVLASLSHYVDDKTWAEEDKVMVKQLAKLMRDVTGIILRKKFKPRAEIEAKRLLREQESFKSGSSGPGPVDVKHAVQGAMLSTKRLTKRLGSQMSMVHRSNICPCKALKYKFFTDATCTSRLNAPSFSGVVLDKTHAQLPADAVLADQEGLQAQSVTSQSEQDEEDGQASDGDEPADDSEARREAADLLDADNLPEAGDSEPSAGSEVADRPGELPAAAAPAPARRSPCVLCQAYTAFQKLTGAQAGQVKVAHQAIQA